MKCNRCGREAPIENSNRYLEETLCEGHYISFNGIMRCKSIAEGTGVND